MLLVKLFLKKLMLYLKKYHLYKKSELKEFGTIFLKIGGTNAKTLLSKIIKQVQVHLEIISKIYI